MTSAWVAALVQQIAVLAIVAACAAYVAWTLAPAAWRRPVARLLLRQRWLSGSATLQKAGRPAAAGACACSGCDHAATSPNSGAKVIRIVPRAPTSR